ncbi:MAG: hypothetical protein J5902_07110 [Paludibacteraceae bacterium]|nr:hypothetical protein [Paludibacteraceae bacterium]
MKKFLLLIAAVLTTISAMAIGDNSGSTKANAIEFNWEDGNVHENGTKWYRVLLDPLYEEENPSLTLYMTNPSRDNSVDVSMVATVAGETENKSYSIAPHQNKSWTANASALVRMKQKEIYLTLTSNGKVMLSAKVFESSDLDETCKDAKTLSWTTDQAQTKGYAAWWKVDLADFKTTTKKDARLCITNTGSGELTLILGQSYDCPSSGLTNRTLTVAAGATLYDTIPGSTLKSLASDELYLSLENNQPLKFRIEQIDQPATPVISGSATQIYVTDDFVISAGSHLYCIEVAEMDSSKKYEPEFTYRNEGTDPANVVVKEAYENPAYSAVTNRYDIAAGEEEIVVYKKNLLNDIADSVEYVYLLVNTDLPIHFSGRWKHVREGKACKTNIDFDWENGHTQAARTTQWYAIDVTDAKADLKDIIVYVRNDGSANAKVKASVAFSCPYIDLQEITRTITPGSTTQKKVTYSTYAMMSDTVWAGVETNQPIKIWVDTVPTTVTEPDEACLTAKEFNWEDGERQNALDTVWYKIGMNSVRNLKQFPTVYVHNLGSAQATVYGELSLECPDSIENEKRSITIAANGTYSKEISRNMFENIKADTVYLRVVATQEVSFEIRLTEEAEGASCASAIRFNWVSGNDQAADANLWYAVDMKEAMNSNKDVEVKLVNKSNEACKGTAWMAYTCPFESHQDANFSLTAKQTKTKTLPHSMFETLEDSVLYVRVIGNTALHFEARLVDPAPFDTIDCSTLSFIDLEWNKMYTQTADTAWYLLSGDVLKSLDTLTTTPQIYVHNLSGASNAIKAEVAYHCPVTSTMMSKSNTFSAGQELTKLIERGTIEQVIKKDSVLVRLVGAGEFEFKAELVNPNTGNDRMHAVKLNIGESYEQEANTTMWYKIDTKEWKADDSLHGKSLHISTKNKGGNAEIKIAAYEDVSETDLLEDHGKRTIPAGKSVSQNIPAYAVYALNDFELYLKVTTNQPVTFSTSTSDYAAAAADPAQADAKLAVPNVDYTIPSGTSWFAICAPYIRNNYKLTDASNVEFLNPNGSDAKVTVLATFQDELTYKVPERTRTIGAGKSYTKTFKELVDKGIKKIGLNYSVEGTDDAYLDELLRKFLTSDSVTAYVRVTTDQPLNIRVNAEQTTGESCANSMPFDWEHGNVNPAGQKTWYVVELDSAKVPEGKDLRLHVENWEETSTTDAKAILYFDCDSSSIKTIDYTLDPAQDLWKDIDRDLLVSVGSANMLIDYTSSNTTRIWVEIIDEKPRDSVVLHDTVPLCNGAEYIDPYTHVTITVDSTDQTTIFWRDSFEFRNDTAMAMWDSIVYTHVVVLQDPQMYLIDSIADQPVIKRGEVIDYTAADTWLQTQLENERTDSIKIADTILWEYSLNGTDFEPIPLTPLSTEAVVLRYLIVTECEDTVTSELFYNTVRDTLDTVVCNYFTWHNELPLLPANDSTYKETTLDSITYPLTNGCDSIAFLNLTVNNPLVDTLEAVAKYGNRLLMINLNAIKESTSWNLPDSIDDGYVTWYRVEASGDVEAGKGYYITNNGEPMVGEYYAVISIPGSDGSCGNLGYTNHLVCEAPAGAPALMPSLAQPGENIRIVNLDPAQETIIRIYSTEGLIQSIYTVRGEKNFTIKAAADHGFYLVELSNDSMKSTLRYIVK